MGRLIYSAIASLDGYVADLDGDFSWAAPDEEVHAFVNDLLRPVGTYLYGRRIYAVMSGWQTAGTDPQDARVVRDFGEMWRAADKVVYSSTLAAPWSPLTRIERQFAAVAVRDLVARSDRDVTVGGPGLAGSAFRAGLVSELQLFVVPAIVGGGTALLPENVPVRLRLLDTRRFRSGFVFLRYATQAGPVSAGTAGDSMTG